MHIHIIGICGTFMGGLAQIAKQQGHQVTGCDTAVYPPMSETLSACGIDIIEGFAPSQLASKPDMILVGNAISRGNPLLEAVLNANIPYTSGPQWLAENILKQKRVLAVAGTHGKTTTSSMLAWILHHAGKNPSFLIGGVAQDFEHSARLGEGEYFVIEADEYDSAFFDKRPKFMHYRPHVLLLNNLEFDHADIYPDLAAIKRQFHYCVRTVPGVGHVVVPEADSNLNEVIAEGLWSHKTTFGEKTADWTASICDSQGEGSEFEVFFHGESQGIVRWQLFGHHNVNNALAAIACAQHAGVASTQAIAALNEFGGVKRRLSLVGTVNEVQVYDDFAHHPTAIGATLDALRRRAPTERIIAVVEFGSNTMRLGHPKPALIKAFVHADKVIMLRPDHIDWDIDDLAQTMTPEAVICHNSAAILAELMQCRPNDRVIIMSNRGFDNLPKRTLTTLSEQSQPTMPDQT